jgi:hypothetical protein
LATHTATVLPSSSVLTFAATTAVPQVPSTVVTALKQIVLFRSAATASVERVKPLPHVLQIVMLPNALRSPQPQVTKMATVVLLTELVD